MNKTEYIRKWIIKNWPAILITTAYFLFHFYLVYKHEAWRDESQAWVITKNTSLSELFKDLCVEGHPCLWFLLIRPFAKLGFSFYGFSLISLCLMTITYFIFLSYSPFKWHTKIIVLFSSIFLYINPIICRSYSLIMMLVILLSLLWKDRFKYSLLYGLLVSLLLQTHIMMVGFSIGLLIDLFIELFNKGNNKKPFIPFGISVISFIALFVELFQRKDMPNTIHVSSTSVLDKIKIDNILKALDTIKIQFWGISNNTLAIILISTLLIIFITWLIIIVKNNKIDAYYRELIVFVCGVGTYLCIACFVYPQQHKQMLTCLLVMFVFFCWVTYKKQNESRYNIPLYIIVTTMCALTVYPAFQIMRYDFNDYLSTSKDTATYIINNVEENGVIVVKQDEYITPVYSYVLSKRSDITFWSVDTKDYYKIHRWGEEFSDKDLNQIKEISTNNLSNQNIYYLSSEDINGDNLVYSIDYPSYYIENYWLYKLK